MQVATNMRAIEIPKINDIFLSMDREKTGSLSKEECTAGLIRLGVPTAVAAETAASLDVDGDGRIDYSELVAGVITFFDDHLDVQLWKVFTSMDTDGSGTLELDEIRTLLKQGELHNLGLVPPEADIERTLRALDGNNNGQISFDEFKAFFTPKSH